MMKTPGVTSFLAMLGTVVLVISSAGRIQAQSSDTNRDDASATSTSTKDESDIEKRIKNAAQVLEEVMGQKDKAIPDKIMSDAECIAVVPSMVKIAIGFGGSHGKGVATCRTETGWSAPAPFGITGGSWGL
jgi:lipid-binding SYLF domain-containing protein